MKSMKGQAALEFMMTYGWAILVVLAAIGALSYFGILDPSRFTPDTCMASSGFSCDGKPVGASDNVVFTVSNGAGFDITLDNVKSLVLGPSLISAGCTTPNVKIADRGNTSTGTNTYILRDGGSATINVSNCTGFKNLNIIKGDLTFNYTNAKSALPETVKIAVVAKPK